MTDDEVLEWLDEEERGYWNEDPHPPRGILASLAEARRVIAHVAIADDTVGRMDVYSQESLDAKGEDYEPFMTRYDHRRFVLAMPRPVKP